MPAESIEGKNLLELDIPVEFTFKDVKYISAMRLKKKRKKNKNHETCCFAFQIRLLSIENRNFSF